MATHVPAFELDAVEPLTKRPEWKALEAHYNKLRGLQLRALFAEDPTRDKRYTTEAAGIYLDYSKIRITDETLNLLIRLAEESGLRARIDAMFPGSADYPRTRERNRTQARAR